MSPAFDHFILNRPSNVLARRSLVAGYIADFLATYMARRNKGVFEPEMRLLLMIPYAVLVIAGCRPSSFPNLCGRRDAHQHSRRRWLGRLVPQPRPLDGARHHVRLRQRGAE